MKVEIFKEARDIAKVKWREYVEAAKKSKDPVYKDLKRMYNNIKNGKDLCDITVVLANGGVHTDSFHPKLAIAKASAKKVTCLYDKSGSIIYSARNASIWWNDNVKEDVRASLPVIPDAHRWRKNWDGKLQVFPDLRLEAPVPMIPPKHMPKRLTDEHYILWEVDEWRMVPPTDPYLLLRVTKNIFAIEAQWDLTPIEKAAMAGRM